MGERLVFWRDAEGRVYCHLDSCAHRGAALSAGRVVEGSRIQCPFHGLEYDPGGRCTLIPANGRAARVEERFRVPVYPTHEEHGFVWIYWGRRDGMSAAPPGFFGDLDRTFAYASIVDPWETHYSRVIENQLDVAHLPFVHWNTIGRGGATLVDGPVVEWQTPDVFRLYPFNRVDDGSRARTPEEVERPSTRGLHLEFRFPNLWQNRITESVRVVAAFVPVDEEHTLLYLRFYQRFVRIPGLAKLVCRLAMPMNRRIAHQDRRVVSTQCPKRSQLKGGEQLFQADGPILAYRKRREELLAEAARRSQG
jgi:phenylpropionate dioxygenase-like ring-hydroxylating dioxygenase large terminal subunit